MKTGKVKVFFLVNKYNAQVIAVRGKKTEYNGSAC